MKVMPARGWNSGETPVAPAGLRVQAFATGFLHPRIVYPLPNGDVLIVESNGPKAPVYRPKDYIEGKIKACRVPGLQAARGSACCGTETAMASRRCTPCLSTT
jgi:glucose/arabinose dehydrogenase